MPTPPPTTPVEQVASTLGCLSLSLAAHGTAGRLRLLLIGLIEDLIRTITACLAALAAGTDLPHRLSPSRPPATPRPRRTGTPPLLPDRVGGRAQQQFPLRDEAMAAPPAAAPASPGRPLRRMPRARPPPILARPRPKARPRTPPVRKTAAPRAPPQARACGPPQSA